MKEIINILVESQVLLNEIENNHYDTLKQLEFNKTELINIIDKTKAEKDLYNKYIDILNVIIQSAKELLHFKNEVYKLQPLIFYYCKTYSIEKNRISFYIRGKEIIFDSSKNKIIIQDEYFIENDQLYEKRNIPLIIKTMAAKKDFKALSQLEDYIKELIDYAQTIIDKECFL